MESAYCVKLLTPEKTVLDSEVSALVAPGTEGFLGVLANHAPLITGLDPGPLTLTYPGGRKEIFALGGGFLEVSNNRAMVLADSVERPDEIDPQRAQEALERAKMRLKERSADFDFDRAEAALKRAINRMRMARRARF